MGKWIRYSKSVRALLKLGPVLLMLGIATFSHAQAFTIAVPQDFAINPNSTLNIGAPGVLQYDLYSGPVDIVLVSTTLHGTLTLMQNGGFTYVPNANYTGPDRFEYELEDSTGNYSDVVSDYIAVGAVNNITYDHNPFQGATSTSNTNKFYVSLNYYPASPVTISCKSSDPSLVSIPTTVTSIAGQYYSAAPMTIEAVSATTAVTISAEFNDYTYSSTLYLVPPSPSGISLSNSNPTGGDGNAVTATVAIYGAAPTGGLVVDLTSSDTSAATVPATVTVPANASNVNFSIKTYMVPTYRRVTITASTAGGKASVQMNVQQFYVQFGVTGSAELLSYPGLNFPAIVGGNDPSGEFNTATVLLTLSSTAPAGGLTVPLVYDCYVPGATGPATVTFPAGKTTVTIKMSLTGYATSPTQMYIGTYLMDTSNYSSVYVYPPLPVISLDDDDYEFGGETFPVYVSLLGFAPPGGASVALTSTSAYAPLPASVLIPAGQNETVLNIKPAATASFQPAMLTASYSGFSSATAFVVLSPQVDELVLSSYKVTGGASVTGTIYLDGVAPTGGTKVNLVGSPASLVGPTSVTVPAGKSSVSFTLTTKAVTTATNVDIDAYTWKNTEWGDSENILLEP